MKCCVCVQLNMLEKLNCRRRSMCSNWTFPKWFCDAFRSNARHQNYFRFLLAFISCTPPSNNSIPFIQLISFIVSCVNTSKISVSKTSKSDNISFVAIVAQDKCTQLTMTVSTRCMAKAAWLFDVFVILSFSHLFRRLWNREHTHIQPRAPAFCRQLPTVFEQLHVVAGSFVLSIAAQLIFAAALLLWFCRSIEFIV